MDSSDSGSTHFVFMRIDGSVADSASESCSGAWGPNLPCGGGVLSRQAKVQHVDFPWVGALAHPHGKIGLQSNSNHLIVLW